MSMNGDSLEEKKADSAVWRGIELLRWIYTHQHANVPDIDTVSPRDIKYDLRCSVDVRLNIISVCLLSKASLAEIAKYGATLLFGHLESSRFIDHLLSIDFTRTRVA